MQKLISFVKHHVVLLVASVVAAVSCFFVTPDKEYLSYPDYKVICLLFCLMAVVAGLQKAGLFSTLSALLGAKIKTARSMGLFLTLICFFAAMFITNDVALITFVPFAILTLSAIGRKDLIIYTVTLQTIAANLGSMATPIGNPQNLYLYEKYDVPAAKFFTLTLPVVGVSLFLLCVCWLFVKNAPIMQQENHPTALEKKGLLLHSVLFLLCLLCVLRVLDYRILTLLILLALLCFDRKLFRMVDYPLLLTFLAFFIFVGNLTRIEAISDILSGLMQSAPFGVSLLCSQVISNVPAAMLLASFCQNANALILGVNIGGLGTLIASLASLISFEQYGKMEGAKKGRYLLVFTGMNLAFLGVLSLLGIWMA